MSEKGTLYLVPTPICEQGIHTIPAYVIDTLHQLDVFIAERVRTARRFIASTDPPGSIDDMTFYELSKRTPHEEIPRMLAPLDEGRNVGLLSEAGCPGIADPGAAVISMAHRRNYTVIPLVGPSSILLALMASGLNGQQFAFRGYLPRKAHLLGRELKKLERISSKNDQTQIFIETPYRNNQLVKEVLRSLSPETRFCIACDLSAEEEFVSTRRVSEWKNTPPPDLHKRPAIFLLYSGRSLR
ncbi:MAG: SAM-dependent methyltransferase [Saprospiraceae bacterium]|nr:SAM-dependent methyltransferase [Saprospiraceae bacterium]